MARPKNAALLERYRGKIAVSKQWRTQEQHDELWKRMIDLYRGRQWSSLGTEDRAVVNMAFSTINIIVPSVSVNHPRFTVNAQTPENAANAVVTEAVLNYMYRAHRMHPEFKRAVKDSRVLGHGWVKIGWKYVKEDVATAGEVPVVDSDGIADVPDQYPTDETAVADEVTSNVVVKEDRPFVEHVSVFDIYVDPDATSMANVGWIAQKIRRPIRDVKADKRYKPKARQAVSATLSGRSTDPRSDTTTDQAMKDSSDGYVDVWEFYDVNRCVMCTFADSSDDFLIAPTKIPYDTGHPFVRVSAYEVPEHFYPMGDLEAIEVLQQELNETRSQMLNHRKKFSRKWLYAEAALDPDGVKALKSSEDNIMVPITWDRPITDAIAPMPSVITPPEFYNQSDIIQGDIDRVSGVSDYQRGGMPEIRRTATEAGIMADAANARASDALANIEDCLAELGERIIRLMQQFLTTEQVARISGVGGEPVWIKFDSEFIEGTFDYEVEAGSTQPNNEMFRRQQAIQLVEALGPFAEYLNIPELIRHIMSVGFGVKDTDRFLAPPAPPQPEQPPQGAVPPGMPPGGAMPPGMPGAPPMAPQPPMMAPQGPMPPDMGGMPPGMPPMGPMPGAPDPLAGLPPELLASLPPEIAALPPELIMELLSRSGIA